jgi:hypothetical protein
MVIYSVAGIKDLTTVIIPHFLNYPLLTQKAADFVLFQRVVELMTNKAHLTKPGLELLKKIKSGMNTGRNYPALDTNTEPGSYPNPEPPPTCWSF